MATLKSWDAPICVIQMEVLSRKLVRLCQKHHIQIEMPTPAIRAALTRDFPALDPLIIDSLANLGRRAGMSASEHLGKQEVGRMLRNYHMEKDAALVKEDATLRPVTELPAGFRPGVKSNVRGLEGLLMALPAEERHFDEIMTHVMRGPDTCSICGAIWPCQEHFLGHLEPAFQLDADGKPCGIKEISICPGPDPNGLTTLKSPEEPV